MITIDTYIAAQSPEKQKILKQYRELLKKLAPKATEEINYGVACFRYMGKPLVFFGAGKEHTSLFPANGSLIIKYKDELKEYKTSKGTIQFPLDKPLPIALLTKIIKERIKENEAHA